MNYATIRDRIYTLLTGVTNIGTVHKTQQYAADWSKYFAKFKIVDPANAAQHIIGTCWISRLSNQETDLVRSERRQLLKVDRVETWQIVLVRVFNDDGVTPSETAFQELLDAIQTKFRFENFLGIPNTVAKSYPVQVNNSGLAMFGDVLCHRADMTLKVQQ